MLAWSWPVSSAAHPAFVFHHFAGTSRWSAKMAALDSEVVGRAWSDGGTGMCRFGRGERMEWVSILSEVRVDARKERRIWGHRASGHAECSRPGRCPLTGQQQDR